MTVNMYAKHFHNRKKGRWLLMHLGISTACLYPMATEESLSRLLGRGFRLFEIFINTASELEEGYYQKELCSRLKQAGALVTSIHPFTSAFENMLLFSDYPRRTEDGLAFYRRYFEMAQQLGARYLVLHGQRNYQKSRIPEEEYFARYARLFRLGKEEYGIITAQENVAAFRSEKAAFIRKMRETLGKDCAFVLDIKQAVRAGEDPEEMRLAMGKNLVHVHLNDHTPGKDCMLPGKGIFCFESFFRKLRDCGYQGDGVIEVYRGDFGPEEQLNDAMDYLQAVGKGLL